MCSELHYTRQYLGYFCTYSDLSLPLWELGSHKRYKSKGFQTSSLLSSWFPNVYNTSTQLQSTRQDWRFFKGKSGSGDLILPNLSWCTCKYSTSKYSPDFYFIFGQKLFKFYGFGSFWAEVSNFVDYLILLFLKRSIKRNCFVLQPWNSLKLV